MDHYPSPDDPKPPPEEPSPPSFEQAPPPATDPQPAAPAPPPLEQAPPPTDPPPPSAPAPGPTSPASVPVQQGAWYSGPWPAPGLSPVESTGSAIGRTAIKALTALVVLFGLPILAMFGLIAAFAALGSAAAPSTDTAGQPGQQFVAGERSASTRLVAVPVIGGILGEERGGGGFLSAAAGVTYGYSIKERLLDLAEDDDVDGVLLELDSPGGTIFGSKAIADGVAEYQAKTGKPVVAYVSGISASGGVYAMAGADEIVADHGTLVGSIGVIFGPFVRYNDIVAVDGGLFGGGVTTEGGITYEFLSAGRHKDFGSPYRDMTDEERKTLEEGLDDAYDQFVAHVAAGRDLSEAEIKDDLGALIFGEEQALSRGLIDAIGPREAAHQRLAELAGADGDDWRLDRTSLQEPSFFDLLTGAATDVDAPQTSLPTLCTGSATMLAYHGDPVSLCSPLLDANPAD